MGSACSHERRNVSDSYKFKNALGLSPPAMSDINDIMALVTSDTPTHCIQAHIKYFRLHPKHLERFCGKPQQKEPQHYSPYELSRDKQFADRSVIHGLALLQVLRCSNANDEQAMNRLAAGLAHAHSSVTLTKDELKDYADVLIDYLKTEFKAAMTPAVTLSWRQYLYGLASAMATTTEVPFHQNRPVRPAPPAEFDERQKLVQDIRNTMLYDTDSISRTAAWLIRNCQRKILRSSPPMLTDALKRKNTREKEKADDKVPRKSGRKCPSDKI